MRVVVDRAKCLGHGQCELAAAELFGLDDDGYAQVLIPEPGEQHRAGAETAALRCPETAIRVED